MTNKNESFQQVAVEKIKGNTMEKQIHEAMCSIFGEQEIYILDPIEFGQD